MGRTALILGAGIGGITVARALRKRLPAEDRVVVVERERNHVFAPSLLWHIVGDSEPAEFTRPLVALQSMGIELVRTSDATIPGLAHQAVLRPALTDRIAIGRSNANAAAAPEYPGRKRKKALG